MFRRALALTMLVLLLAAFTLQGAAFLRCACSGEIVLAGWDKAECLEARECWGATTEENCCGGNELDGTGVTCRLGCYFLVGAVPKNLVVKASESQIPSIPIAGFVPVETPDFSAPPRPTDWVPPVNDPDPPGVPLRVIYASFLI